MTQNVPGLMVRSVYPDAAGMPLFSAGSFRTTDASPFKERFGGWYVTGTHGSQTHVGNAVASDPVCVLAITTVFGSGDVVCVHAKQPFTVRQSDQVVESADDAGIGTADDMDARILLFEASQLCERVVSRAVVEDEKLKFAMRLTQNAFDSSADVTRCVVDGKQH